MAVKHKIQRKDKNQSKGEVKASKLKREMEDEADMEDAPEGMDMALMDEAEVAAREAAERAAQEAELERLEPIVGLPLEQINFDFHLRENLGKVQFLSKDVSAAVMPTGFSAHSEVAREHLHGGMVCVTRPLLQRVTNYMLRFENKVKAGAMPQMNPTVLLDGERGTGKSHILDMATIWAKQRGWRIIYVPNCWDIANRSAAVYKSRVTGLQEQPDMAQDFIARALAYNEAWMQTIRVPGPESLGSEPVADAAPVSLVELAKHGLHTDNQAVEVAAVIKSRFVSEPGPPLLVAIDQFNSMFDKTNYDDGRKNTKNYIRARDLTLCDMLIKLATEPLPGVALVASTRSKPVTRQYFEKADYEATLAKFRWRAKVGGYRAAELGQVINEYNKLRLLNPSEEDVKDGVLAEGYRAYVAAMSASVPERVFNVAVQIMI